MNCVPYIELLSDKGPLRFLIDTGANKNYIRKDLVQEDKIKKVQKPTEVTTVNGKFIVDSFVYINLFKQSKFANSSPFFIFKFHDFFHGLIGWEYLQKSKAIIDAAQNSLHFPDLDIKLLKKFPARQFTTINSNELTFAKISIDTPDGDFCLIDDHEIRPGVFANAGIYRAVNGEAFIAISNLSDSTISLPQQNLKSQINNFETKSISDGSDKCKINFRNQIRFDHLYDNEKAELFKVLDKFSNSFYSEGDPLTFTNAIKHRIVTTDDAPVHAKTYRYPVKQKEEVSRQIREYLNQNIIQDSTYPYSAPIWVVSKKLDASGKQKWRLVIDYRKLNNKTVDDRYPIPNITEILDSLGKSKYFSTLDLASGFNQIEIHPKDIEKTAFSVDNGHYEFLRMPFGLKNSLSTFQRVMDNILREYIGKICLVYLDDIIVFSRSLEEHSAHLTKILQAFQDNNLKVQIHKCEFFRKEVNFLGHVITPEGVKPNPDKIKVVQNWHLPKNETELRGFLGTIGYYRRFIQDFAKIVKPLTEQLKKGQVVTHTKQFLDTFERCKGILVSSQILQYPDFSKPFKVTTDASQFAIGAVLSQGPDGKDRPIAFASRTLSKSEVQQSNSTIENEALAIIYACKYFRPYIYGHKFTLFTDHKPLIYMFNMKDPSSRLVRWRLTLEEYDYDVQFKPGSQNVVADGLSRINHDEAEINAISNTDSSTENASLHNNVDELQSDAVSTAHSAQSDNSNLIEMTLKPINGFSRQIVFQIAEEEKIDVQQIFPNMIRTIIQKPTFSKAEILDIFKNQLDFKKVNCLLCSESIIQSIQEVYKEFLSRNKSLRIVIAQTILRDVTAQEEQDELIEETHQRAHRGIFENLSVLNKKVYFPRMKAKIKAYVKLCSECKMAKYDRKPPKVVIEPTPIPLRPFDIVHIDIFISGQNLFLSAVDKLSRFGMLFPIKSKAISDVRKALIKIFSTYGQPKMLVSDNEPALKSIEIRDLLQSHDS